MSATTTLNDRHYDYYRTPNWMTDVLLEHSNLKHYVSSTQNWEPFAGDGSISNRIEASTNAAKFSKTDIDPKSPSVEKENFWSQHYRVADAKLIVANPPWNQLDRILGALLHEGTDLQFLALLLRVTALGDSENRANMMAKFPVSQVISMPRYCWRRGKEGNWTTDSATAAWFIWSDSEPDNPIMTVPRSCIPNFTRNPEEEMKQNSSKCPVCGRDAPMDCGKPYCPYAKKYEVQKLTT